MESGLTVLGSGACTKRNRSVAFVEHAHTMLHLLRLVEDRVSRAVETFQQWSGRPSLSRPVKNIYVFVRLRVNIHAVFLLDIQD